MIGAADGQLTKSVPGSPSSPNHSQSLGDRHRERMMDLGQQQQQQQQRTTTFPEYYYHCAENNDGCYYHYCYSDNVPQAASPCSLSPFSSSSFSSSSSEMSTSAPSPTGSDSTTTSFFISDALYPPASAMGEGTDFFHPDSTPYYYCCSPHGDHVGADASSDNRDVVRRSKPKKKKESPPSSSAAPISAEVRARRRLAANARERKRMTGLNAAFERLRAVLPRPPPQRRRRGGEASTRRRENEELAEEERPLSKMEALQLAQTYIAELVAALGEEESARR